MTIKYATIRGPNQRKRCTDPIKGSLYCKCGCMAPRDDDPRIDLTGIVVSGRAPQGYADYTLTRNGKRCGEINTQYCALMLDGHEFFGCSREDLRPLLDQIFADGKSLFDRPENDREPAGDSLAETAANVRHADSLADMEMDAAHKGQVGYCTKCHTYCFGDCEA